jgi:hypothetical protein
MIDYSTRQAARSNDIDLGSNSGPQPPQFKAEGIMRLDRKGIIGGQPIRRVRDFLRRYRDGRPDPDAVVEFFDIDLQAVNALVGAMVEQGLIIEAPEPWDRRPVVHAVTELGVRFAAASLLKPIPRSKADRIVSDLLARVEEVNARDDLTHFVGEVRAFGSYISDATEVGDIDLAISLIAKPPPCGTKFTEWHVERARQSGRSFGTYIDMLFYSQNEVRQLIKGRNQYTSIHPMSDLDELKIESRVLYKSPDRPVYFREHPSVVDKAAR